MVRSRAIHNVLAAIAAEALQFGSLYRTPSRTGTAHPSSYGILAVTPAPARVSVKTKPPPKATHNSLNSIVDYVQRFDTVYLEQEITPDMFGPRRHSFFRVRHSSVALALELSDRMVHMKELNAMARAIELSSDSYAVYPEYTPPHRAPSTYDVTKRYGRHFPCPFAAKLRQHLKLHNGVQFTTAFPSTAQPKALLFNGLPKVDRSAFSSLLKWKLDSARLHYHTQHTPSWLPRLVTQWINSVLRTRPETTPSLLKKKAKKSKSSKQKDRITLDLQARFVTSTPAKTDVPEPDTKELDVSVPHLTKEENVFSSLSPSNYVSLFDVITTVPAEAVQQLQPAVHYGEKFGAFLASCQQRSPMEMFVNAVSGSDSQGDYIDLFQMESIDDVLPTLSPFPPGTVSGMDLTETRSLIKKLLFFASIRNDPPSALPFYKECCVRLFFLTHVLGLARSDLQGLFDDPDSHASEGRIFHSLELISRIQTILTPY